MPMRQFLILLISASAIALASTSHALLPLRHVNADKFPSSVAFIFTSNASKCTAVKVAPKIFLTAAHCFLPYQNGSFVKIEKVSRGQQTLDVETHFTHVRIHPGYRNPGRIRTIVRYLSGDLPDLALFRINDDIDIPAAKINFGKLQVGQNIMVGGFGSQGRAHCRPILHPCSMSMALQKVARTKGEFFTTQPTELHPHYLTVGDSGGPAYIRNPQTRQLEVIGVNSMMAPANALQLINMITSSEPPRAASVYIRIGSHRAWYTNALRELERIN